MVPVTQIIGVHKIAKSAKIKEIVLITAKRVKVWFLINPVLRRAKILCTKKNNAMKNIKTLKALSTKVNIEGVNKTYTIKVVKIIIKIKNTTLKDFE